jgi:hypothetical protein
MNTYIYMHLVENTGVTTSLRNMNTDSSSHYQDIKTHSKFNIANRYAPIEPKPLRIIYVPDPTRCACIDDAEHDISFVKTTISEDEYEATKTLHNSVHLRTNTRMETTGKSDKIKVIIQEWVSVHISTEKE